MSTDKVDAREAYLAEARRLLERAMFPVAAYDADAMRLARDAVMEHLRTQPEGYVLVPVEPTPAMSAAGFVVSEAEHDPAGVYRAMIAAAQEGK